MTAASPRGRAGLGRLGRAVVIGIPAAWFGLTVLLPFAIVVKMSVSEPATAQPPYRPQLAATLDPERWRAVVGEFGLDNYRRLWADTLHRDAFATSLGLALVATAIVVPLGTAIALAVVRAPLRFRAVLIAAILLPFWTSFLVRVYAWIAILKENGWLDTALAATGVLSGPLALGDTSAAALIGLVYAYLPFMILPVYASLDRQDPALVEAAADLGATPLRRFWTITLPLAWPGLAAGALLCFIPMVGEFVIPELLGGSDTLTVGRTLWSEFFSNRDWPLAAAVAVALVLILVPPIVLFREAEARRLEAAR